jgi:hypothetical protein
VAAVRPRLAGDDEQRLDATTALVVDDLAELVEALVVDVVVEDEVAGPLGARLADGVDVAGRGGRAARDVEPDLGRGSRGGEGEDGQEADQREESAHEGSCSGDSEGNGTILTVNRTARAGL